MRTCRQVVGFLSCLSADRLDCCSTIREHERGMKDPTVEHWQMLRRLGRYLIIEEKLNGRNLTEEFKNIL